MAKGAMRPAKEAKKPKKDKAAKPASTGFEKGVSANGDSGKKKG